MLIKMKTGLSGPETSLSPGDITDADDDEALRLINADFARALTDAEADAFRAEQARAAQIDAESKAKSDAVQAKADADAEAAQAAEAAAKKGKK